MNFGDVTLLVLAMGFAWSMGAHYTGACMGMPYATGSIRLRPALALMAVMTFFGAVFLSHGVLATVGTGIIRNAMIDTRAATVIVGVAFALTTLFNLLRIPTSTIQIMVPSMAGVSLAFGFSIQWAIIAKLAVLWVVAPFVALVFGFLLTRMLDRLRKGKGAAGIAPMGRALVLVGALASLTMGANDVSNATAVFLTTHRFDVLAAGIVGGLGLAIGVMTWGRPLLMRVAFDVVKMDLTMATAAQLVQGLVVLTVVWFGYFTSMNQALIGAMAGAGLARGRETVQWPVVRGILLGWMLGPLAGLILSYVVALAVRKMTM